MPAKKAQGAKEETERKKVTYQLTVALQKRLAHAAIDVDANISDLVEQLLVEALDVRDRQRKQ